MGIDALPLARIQFALTIMFHYLFPPLSIGLGWMMVMVEGTYLRTGNRLYESIARFLTGIFAVNFAMGVATGIVMEFQFGTNWSTYSRFVGDVFGSALAAEGIFAFFLESGFLAVLVFGWDRVSPRMHFFSTLMVAVGAFFSSIWIVVANSWQQTPAGHHIVGGRAEITDFWQVVFNPSSMHRLIHVLIGAFILAAFFVMSISAYYILKNRHQEAARAMFRLGLVVAAVASLLQLLSGHWQAEKVSTTQPAKLAAFEGHFVTGPAPLYFLGIPDEQEQRVKAGVGVPGMLSFLLHGDTGRAVDGLDQVPRGDWPPVALSFQTYHIMVGLGMFFIVLTFYGLFLLQLGTLFEKRWLLWVFVFAVIGPYIANQFGWVAAEVGRQPWIVYGLLRTSEAVSPSVPGSQVLGSIVIFALIYAMLFAVFVYVLNDKIHRGPEPVSELPPQVPAADDLFRTAAELVEPGGRHSMTMAHEEEEGDAPEEAGSEPPEGDGES